MTYIDGAINALEQERASIEKTMAESAARLEQVDQAISTMRTIAHPAGASVVVPQPQPSQSQHKHIGFTKGIRAQVMRALAGGSASSTEISAVTRIDERDIRHALSTMVSEGLCAWLSDGKYVLTSLGGERAAWLLQHPHARQFGGNLKGRAVQKNGNLTSR